MEQNSQELEDGSHGIPLLLKVKWGLFNLLGSNFT